MWDAYNHFMPPNSTAARPPTISTSIPGALGTSRSTTTYGGWGTFMDAIPPSCNHPGGVNICFRRRVGPVLKNQITYQTWWALGTRNGQEALSSDAY